MLCLLYFFVGWVAPDPSGSVTKAFCKYCKCTLTAHKKDLINHAKSQKHERKVSFDAQAKSCQTLNFALSKTNIQKEAE